MLDIFKSGEFWVLLSFLGFVGLVIYFRAPHRVLEALDGRAREIEKKLKEAESLEAEAAALLARRKKAFAELGSAEEQILAEARSAAEQLAEEAVTRAEEQMKRRALAVETRLTRAAEAAGAQMRRETADLALQAARLLIGEKMEADKDFSKTIAAQSLKEIERAG